MCGIFGFVSNNQIPSEEILTGLKTLEYRGYDSWGIAIKNKTSIATEKHIGKITNARINFSKTNIGIGHTRWATHGGVTVKNAHPHLDCAQKIALMHNGIVENYLEIKKLWRKKAISLIRKLIRK